MAVDHRLVMLRQTIDRASVPDGRTVVMVARVTPALGVGDLSCLAPFAVRHANALIKRFA